MDYVQHLILGKTAPLTKGREKNPRALTGLQAVDLVSPSKGESREQL